MFKAAVNIVGVGGTLMGDDGAGPAVIEALRRRGVPEGVNLYDAGLAVSDVLGQLAPAEPLIVIDAIRAGGEPGSIYKVRLDEMHPEEGSLTQCLSLHELSVVPALRIEALTGRNFTDVTVFGIEPATMAWGEGLSPAADDAVERLAKTILERLGARCACTGAGDSSP